MILSSDQIKKELEKHLNKVNEEHDGFLDSYEIHYITEHFGYMGPEVCERYVDDVTIDGEEYEKRACWVGEKFWSFYGAPCFMCYSYYRTADLPNHTVKEYMESKKLYSLEIDKDDFPDPFFE